ncbi:hypothetical protein B0H17DRAFT_1135186 [Mycena rosella]|uniref:Uncharacterized protein n=1 Tax=Mycena rosella TaxID=1033263 RepID=A0AAD7DDS0_MYCRO|nr:hypothetical protein B0H17DRAFT_1135186 [Mycena rosella]
MVKRKHPDMIMESSTTLDSDDSTGSSNSGSSDEEVRYHYESVSRDVQGRAVYTSTEVSVAVPAPPKGPVPVLGPAHRGPDRDSTWIYDFMDNDWAFGEEEAHEAEGEAAEEVPESSDSDDSGLGKKKRKREPRAGATMSATRDVFAVTLSANARQRNCAARTAMAQSSLLRHASSGITSGIPYIGSKCVSFYS